MKLVIHHKIPWGFCVLLLLAHKGLAQLSFSGQLRTRSEYRAGQGTLLKPGETPAFFTSQRTRFSIDYATHRLTVRLTGQDVRVWGQDASTINRTTNGDLNGLMLHEAWAELNLLDTSQIKTGRELTLRLGRQELVYDESRLLGNLDWLQQGRRHDLALLKYGYRGWTLHAGLAYNQNRELKTGTVYNGVPTGYPAGTNGIGTLYKAMQFVYLGRKLKGGTVSLLALKDDFNRYTTTPASATGTAPAKVYGPGVWSRVTVGAYANVTRGKWTVRGEAYRQTGRDRDGRSLRGSLLAGSLTYATSRRTALTIGEDYTSGNEPTATAATPNRRFDPLYGTPHKFWGLMDFFYVADGFGQGGLSDFYLRGRYKPSDKLTFLLDVHQFSSTNTVRTADRQLLDSSFGQEYDLVGQYVLSKQLGVEGGYGYLRGTTALAVVKGIPDARKNAHWAYLMINLKF